MLDEVVRSSLEVVDLAAPCLVCGKPPAGAVQIGGGLKLFWLECKTCGRKTSDGQTYLQAVQQWNAMQSHEP